MISVLGGVSSLALGDGLVKLIESASLFLFVSGLVCCCLLFLELVYFSSFVYISDWGRMKKTKFDVLCIMSTLLSVLMQSKDVRPRMIKMDL